MGILEILGIFSIAYVIIFTIYQAAKKSHQPGQSIRHSLAEAWTNIIVGYTINYISNLIIFPMAGYQLTVTDAWWIGWIYTVISIVRSFYIRRLFNWIGHNFKHLMANKGH